MEVDKRESAPSRAIHLREEGIVGGLLPVVPCRRHAFRTPVPALQDQLRGGFEGVSVVTLPGELVSRVAVIFGGKCS